MFFEEKVTKGELAKQGLEKTVSWQKKALRLYWLIPSPGGLPPPRPPHNPGLRPPDPTGRGSSWGLRGPSWGLRGAPFGRVGRPPRGVWGAEPAGVRGGRGAGAPPVRESADSMVSKII